MAYGVKYILNAGSKNNLNYIIEISEKDYTGGSTNIPLGVNPFAVNYYSNQDDVFNPIVGSELTFEIDATDFSSLFDFYSDDDFKYLVKLYATTGLNNYYDFLIWQGFLLIDQTQLPFTTGLKFASFKAADGLGLLKSINYDAALVLPDNRNQLRSLKDVVIGCLNQIGFPDLFYINVQISIFATGMNDRGASTDNEPLSQTYTQIRNWLKEPNVYKSCYDVLTEIAEAFGANIFQSNGQFVISQVNERFEDSVYLTKYDSTGALVSSGLFKNAFKIQGYGLAANMYWIDNEQTKVLKKGFNKLVVSQEMRYSNNLFINENFQDEYLGTPVGWFTFSGGIFPGSGTGVANKLGFDCRIIYYNPSDILGNGMNALYLAPFAGVFLFVNDIYTFNYDFLATPPENNFPPASSFKLNLFVEQNATVAWFWDFDNDKWVIGLISNADTYGKLFTINSEEEAWQRKSIKLQPSPVTGRLNVRFWIGVINSQPGPSYARTKVSLYLKNAVLTGLNNEKEIVKSINITGERGNNSNYKLEKTISLGAKPIVGNNMLNGILQDASGVVWADWYRYGDATTFDSLQRLLVQNILNATGKNSLTVQGRVYNIYAKKKNETTLENLEYLSSYEVEDNAGDPLTVSGKRYVSGNTTFNFIDNTINVNLLETGDTDVDATITEEIIYK